ncbi:CTL-like protein [Drosera capensis]
MRWLVVLGPSRMDLVVAAWISGYSDDEGFIDKCVLFLGKAVLLGCCICNRSRLPFSMMVLQKGVKMVWSLPEVMRVACGFILVMLLWMALWTFGSSGVVALGMGDGGRWWLLVCTSLTSVYRYSISLFWSGAVLCNTVHVIVSGMVSLVLIHGGREAGSMPSNSLMKSLQYAVTTSFGSICYGSLFTAAIRTLRWEIREFRSKICGNECLLCCIDFLFHRIETLARFFNKYAYVQIAVSGKSFNHSARDAWELFQSTGVEALVACDCSGAVIMGCVGLAMVVVEGPVTSVYICYTVDPLLIQKRDNDFFN